MDTDNNLIGMNILVVEDNRTQAEYLKHFLEKSGNRVVTASNGIEALDTIRLDVPDIVLTDVIMPEMNGFELCKNLKGNPQTADIPVMLVTYLYNTIDIIRALESGADSVIIKPYNPDDIQSRIYHIIHDKDSDQSVSGPPLTIDFLGESFTISSDRFQIVNILLSTYEIAIRKNSELQVAHERLHYLNAQLQKAVADLEQMNAQKHRDHHEDKKGIQIQNLSDARLLLFGTSYPQVIWTQIQSAIQILLHHIDSVDTDIPELKKGIVKADETLHIVLDLLTPLIQNPGYVMQMPSWQQAYELFTNTTAAYTGQNGMLVCTIPKNAEIFVDSLFPQAIRMLMNFSLADMNNQTLTISLEKRGDRFYLIWNYEGVSAVVPGYNSIIASPEFIIARDTAGITGINLTIEHISGNSLVFLFSIPKQALRLQESSDRG